MTDEQHPTELARPIDATEASLAWSNDDGADDEPTQRILTPRRITTGAVVVSVVIMAAAAGVALHYSRDSSPGSTPAAPATTLTEASPPAAPPPTAAEPAIPLLDGTYRMFHDYENQTYRNNRTEAGGESHWLTDGAPADTWYSFSSVCTDTSCIATGTPLEGAAGPVVPPDVQRETVLILRNGSWVDMEPFRFKEQCTNVRTGAVVGETWESQTMRVEFRPDGTFHGDLTTVVESNDCGDEGNTLVLPIILTWTGDAFGRI